MRTVFIVLASVILIASPIVLAEEPIVDGGRMIRLIPGKSHIFYRLTLREARLQLQEITKIAKMEDMWLCIDGRDLVYDVGQNGTERSISPDFCAMDNSPEHFRNANLVHIHIHTISPGEEDGTILSPPSLADIIFSASYGPEFREKYGAETSFEVLDGRGVWRYGPGKHSCKELSDDDSHLVEQFNAVIHKYRCDHCDNSMKGMSREKKIRLYLAEVHALGIDMTYEDLP